MDHRQRLRPGGMHEASRRLRPGRSAVARRHPRRLSAADGRLRDLAGRLRSSQAEHSTADQDDGSVVTQGVQFPGVDRDSKLGKATSDNATCTDCEWTVSPACIANGPEDDAVCLGATIGVPAAGAADAGLHAARRGAVAADRHDLPRARGPSHLGGRRRRAGARAGGQLPAGRRTLVPTCPGRPGQPADDLRGGGAGFDPDRVVRRARVQRGRHGHGALGVDLRARGDQAVRQAGRRVPERRRRLHLRRRRLVARSA